MSEPNSFLNPAWRAGYSLAADQAVNGITPENAVPVSLSTDLNALANNLALAQGAAQYVRDRNAINDRSTLQTLNDYAGRAVQGIESIGYIPAGVTGALQDLTNIAINAATGSNYDTGHTARYLGAVSDAIEATGNWGLTPAALARQRAIAAESQARQRASDLQYQRDLAKDRAIGRSTFNTELSKIGREAVNAAKAISEPEEAIGLAAESVGQILGQGGVSSLISRGLRSIGRRTASKEVASSGVDKFTNEYGSKIDSTTMVANIGLSEAGGGAAQVVDEIDNMSIQELYAVSPKFNSLVQEYTQAGLSQSEAETRAKEQLKNDSVLQAYGMSIPGSLLASKLGTGMVERPFGRLTNNIAGTRAQALDILGETVEEATTNVASGLINNAVAQANYNINRNLTDNLGQNLVEGAAGGLYPSVALRTPSLIGSVVSTSLNKAGQALETANRATSPITGTIRAAANKVGNTVSSAVNKYTSNLERRRTEQKVNNNIQDINTNGSEKLKSYVNVSDELFEKTGISPTKTTKDGEVRKNIVDVINELQARLDASATNFTNKTNNKEPISTQELLEGLNVSEQFTDILNSTLNAQEHSLDDSSLSEEDKITLQKYRSNAQAFLNISQQAAIEFRDNLINDVKSKLNNKDTASEVLNDINVRNAIKKLIGKNINNENIDELKKLISNIIPSDSNQTNSTGVNLSQLNGMTEQELASWNALNNIINTYKQLIDRTKNRAELDKIDKITDQYFTSEDATNYNTGFVSAHQLIQDMANIASSDEFNSGNKKVIDDYKNKLQNLKLLFTIANNKSKALLQSFNDKDPKNSGYVYTSYRAADKKKYGVKVYVNRLSKNSLDNFKNIVDSQKDLFTLYNNFIDAFPKASSQALGSIPARLSSSSLVRMPNNFNAAYNIAEKISARKNQEKRNDTSSPRDSLNDGTYVNNSDTESNYLSDIAKKANSAFATKLKGKENSSLRKVIREIARLNLKENLTPNENAKLSRLKDLLENTFTDPRSNNLNLEPEVMQFMLEPTEDYLPKKQPTGSRTKKKVSGKQGSADTTNNIPERTTEDLVNTLGAIYQADAEIVNRYSEGDPNISKEALDTILKNEFNNEKDIKKKRVKSFNTLTKIVLNKVFRTRANSNPIYNKDAKTSDILDNVFFRVFDNIEYYKGKYKNQKEIVEALEAFTKRWGDITNVSNTNSPVMVFMQQMQKTLSDQLNTKENKDLLNNSKYSVSQILTQNRTRVLNFTEMTDTGEIRLDPNVALTVAFTAIEFINDLNNYMGNKDIDQISDEYGIATGDLTDDQVDLLMKGANANTLINALTNKLMNHFGYTNVSGSRPGADGKAMMSSLALLTMQTLVNLDVINRTRLDYVDSNNNHISRNVITLADNLYGLDTNAILDRVHDLESQGFSKKDIQVKVSDEALGNTWYKHSRFYGVAKKVIQDSFDSSMDKREFFLEEAMPDVNTISKLNSRARYTKREKESIEGHRKTKYYLNKPFQNLLKKLNVNKVIDLLGVDLSNYSIGLFNVNTTKTIEGKRRTVFNSYITNMERAFVLDFLSPDEPGYIRIDYRMTRNGRFQERLPYGPSADKLSRQLFSPERTEIDLNDPKQLYRYNLALVQAFDIKIKEINNAEVINNLGARIREIIQNHKSFSWFSDNNPKVSNITVATVRDLFNEIGNANNYDDSVVYNGKKLVPSSEVTALGLNAITTVVAATKATNGKFINTLTVEADAPSAGTTNLIAMMDSSEKFNGKQIQGSRRGGHNTGTSLSYADYKKLDPVDNYEAAAIIASSKETELIRNNIEVKELTQDVLDIANLAGLNIQYNDGYFTGSEDAISLTIPRSVAKDAATPMVYEQQLPSATISLLTKVGDFIHEHMTNALQAQAKAQKDKRQISLPEAFYSKEIAAVPENQRQEAIEKAKKDFDTLTKALNRVASTKIGTNNKGQLIIDNARSDLSSSNSQFNKLNDINAYRDFDFFALIKNRNSNLNKNFQQLLVKSIFDAVNDIRGTGVIQTNRLISTVSRTISLLQYYKAVKFINDYVKEHKYMPTEDEINAKLNESSLNSIYNFSYTNLELSGSNAYTNRAMEVFSLDNSWMYGNSIFLPGDPGVSAVPLVTVALSDGAIQREIFRKIQDKIADRYDGSDMGPLNSEEYTKVINEICHNVIMENVLKPFMSKLDSKGKEEITNLLNQLKKDASNNAEYQAIYDDVSSVLRMYSDYAHIRNEGINSDFVTTYIDTDKVINHLDNSLQTAVKNLDNKKKVLAQTFANEQHMVINTEGYEYAGSNEELNTKLKDLEFTSPEEHSNATAKIMNEYLNKDASSNKAIRDLQDERVNLRPQTIQEVLTRFNLLSSGVGSFVNRILSSTLNDNTQIYIGTRNQILSLVQERYPNHNIPDNVQGFQVEKDNTIYIIDEGNTTNTTLAHELVHAATVFKLNKLSSLSNAEVSNLKGRDKAAYYSYLSLMDLKNDFRNLIENERDKSNKDPVLMRELDAAYTHIFEDSSDELTQLKEFIAYAVTTPIVRQFLSGQIASQQSTQSTIAAVTARTIINLSNMFKEVLRHIGNIIGVDFVRTRNNATNLNFLDAMEYNIASITESSFTGSTVNESQNILHYIATDEDSRLASTMKTMDRAIRAAINSRQWNTGSNNTEQNRKVLKVLYARDTEEKESRFNELLANTQRAGFKFTTQQMQAMKTIMSIYSTGYALNPILKSESENLRKIIIDKLSSEDFLATSTSSEEAQSKYDFLANMSGLVLRAYQQQALSTFAKNNKDASLAIFMGMALANPEVRDVLEKTTITKEEIKANRYPIDTANNSVDSFINNLGTRLVDFITDTTLHTPRSMNALRILDNYIATINADSLDYSLLNIPSNLASSFDKAFADKVFGILKKGIDSDLYQNLMNDENSPRWRQMLLATLAGGVQLALATGDIHDTEAIGNIFKKLNSFAVKHPNALGRFVITSAKELLAPDKSLNDLLRIEKEIKNEVQIKRQVYRENMPRIIIQEFAKEGVTLSKEDNKVLHTSYLKCDMGVLNSDEIHQVLTSDYELSRLQSKLEDEVASSVSSGSIKDTILKKSEQLANYMLTGIAGPNLLRNADAIAYLLNEKYSGRVLNQKALINAIDKLVTVYALRDMSSEALKRTRQIYKAAPKATNYAVSQQRALRTKEQYDARTGTNLRFNYYKGYIPYSNKNGASVLVINTKDLSKYEEMGYVKSGNYHGPRIENTDSLIYVTNSVNPRMSFSQGALQSVINLAGGVDTSTGYSFNNIAGRIISPYVIGQYKNKLRLDGGRETFSPVFNDRGQIIALERTVDPSIMNAIKQEDNFAQVIGNWAGRQIEESTAEELNRELLVQLKNNLDNASAEELKGYTNLFDRAKKDPIIRDAINMLSPKTMRAITEIFGNNFMVREDMIDDVIGHRRASIVDSYTGQSRLSPETQRAIRELTRKVFGDKAFVKLYRGERFLMNTVATARNWIVVRSLTVMRDNLLSNIFQLLVRGVPIASMVTEIPQLLKEIETYNGYRRTLTKLEADLQAAKGSSHYNQYQINKINNDIKATREALESQSIYPLIAAGEYNTIADIGDTEDDLDLSMGRWGDYIERKVDMLPDNIKTAGKYLLITKDTALYRALEKGVQYGDFIAKALLYKHLTQRKGYTSTDALDVIRYEFVNYDMLAGRSREFLENIGVLWFYNFKLRTSRVAVSMLRNNPLHSLFFLNAPLIDGLGSPLTDNILSKIMSGGILGSVGPGMGLDFFLKNMWGQMFL